MRDQHTLEIVFTELLRSLVERLKPACDQAFASSSVDKDKDDRSATVMIERKESDDCSVEEVMDEGSITHLPLQLGKCSATGGTLLLHQ